eukprot:1525591-Pyramimonas_sp.AAC.2
MEPVALPQPLSVVISLKLFASQSPGSRLRALTTTTCRQLLAATRYYVVELVADVHLHRAGQGRDIVSRPFLPRLRRGSSAVDVLPLHHVLPGGGGEHPGGPGRRRAVLPSGRAGRNDQEGVDGLLAGRLQKQEADAPQGCWKEGNYCPRGAGVRDCRRPVDQPERLADHHRGGRGTPLAGALDWGRWRR